MLITIKHEKAFESIDDFLKSESAEEWYKKRHPEYDAENGGTAVTDFVSDLYEIKEYYKQKDGIYNVFYDHINDLIIVQEMGQILG